MLNGWDFNFYDLIMPLFLFLVGIAMTYSFRKRLKSNPSKSNLWGHIFIRILILWILGMMVQGKLLTYDLDEIKFYSNTLQAIAAGYLIASLLILNLSVVKQIIATFAIMMLYWVIMDFAPIPNAGAGHYEPELNFAIYIDKLILGKYQDGTTYTWLISSLNFGATTMLGVFTGYLLQSNKKPLIKFFSLFASGFALIIISEIWSIWHLSIKHLWTSSFVLLSGGICILLLAIFYLIIDVLNYNKWATLLVIIGSNAIFAYVSANIFKYKLVSAVFLDGLEKYTGVWFPFLSASGGLIVLLLILRYMYKNKIFIKI